MKLTKKEKQLILNKRKQEKTEEESNKPKLMGFLKQDLYFSFHSKLDLPDWIFSEKEKDKIINDFIASFQIGCKAGTKFVCYASEGGFEEWYSEDSEVENMDADWARKYIKNIGPFKDEK